MHDASLRFARTVRLYALVETGDPEAIDVFLRRRRQNEEAAKPPQRNEGQV
jgi:predicted ATPase